ncbi:MAG: hypothetical protein OHK0019_38050 [Saprospiraceae bacterium]
MEYPFLPSLVAQVKTPAKITMVVVVAVLQGLLCAILLVEEEQYCLLPRVEMVRKVATMGLEARQLRAAVAAAAQVVQALLAPLL